LKSLQTAVVDLRGDLAKFVEQLTGNAARGMREEIVRDVVGRLTPEVQQIQQRLESASLGRDPAADLAAIRNTLAEFQRRLLESVGQVEEIRATVAEPRIRRVVDEATQAAADLVYRDHFEGRVDELAAAFADADDRFGQLKAYVDQFGPGGLPVLKQERDGLAKRVDDLTGDLEAARAQIAEQAADLAEREAAAVRHKLQANVDPELLDQRIRANEERERELAHRETLKSENARLADRNAELQAELDLWGQRAKADNDYLRAEVEHEQSRARAELADSERQVAVRKQQFAEQRAAQAVRDAADARREAESAKAAAAAADSLQKRVDALEAELAAERRAVHTHSAAGSKREATITSLQAEYDKLLAENSALRLQTSTAEQRARNDESIRMATSIRLKLDELNQWADSQVEIRCARQLEELRRLVDVVQNQDRQIEQYRIAGLEFDRQQRGLQGIVESQRLEVSVTLAAKELAVKQAWEDSTARIARELAFLAERTEEQRKEVLRGAETERDEICRYVEEQSGLANDEMERFKEYSAMTAQLAARKGQLEAEITALEDRLHDHRIKAIPDEERVGQLKSPVLPHLASLGSSDQSEATFLDKLTEQIGASGFHFHPRLLRAFHTSLKIADHAPLTVLAGISGTGKSELPRLYADLGGLPFLEIAVQPGWDSPHDLFGFYNYTDGRLKAEPLARLLHQINDKGNELGQSPCIVLLDEMNLARVEYYFADLLSKLEGRRSVLRQGEQGSIDRASVHMDLGPGSKPISLFLSEKVLFVGTMNNDESTLTLSDKVLDRACTLTFPAPHAMTLKDQTKSNRASQRLAWAAWQSWQKEPAEAMQLDRLNSINDIMDKLRRPFGHRLFRAIHAYLANYPGAGQNGDDAWADQWAMKILPRLRGVECDSRSVKPLLGELRNHVPLLLQSAFDEAREGEFFAFSGARDLYKD
jgi:hypothetical protein